jgi:hypothetical protein
MKAMHVLSHIFLSLVLYNAMAFGANQMMNNGGGWLWIFIGLGSAFLMGMQLMLVVIEFKGESK